MSMFELTDDPARIDFDRAYAMLAETYWYGSTTRETFDRAVANCFCVAAFAGDAQVGFGRAITDYATFAWVSDVVVDPATRGQGVGRAIVGHMLAHPRLQGLRRWNLNTRDAQGVYAPLGFQIVTDASAYMERLDPAYGATLVPLT